MVDLVIDKDEIGEKSELFYEKFDVVCMLGYPLELQVMSSSISL